MIITSRRAFTLAEVMIVVVIIAIILAVAIPNYLKSGKVSQKTACMANLERIDSATKGISCLQGAKFKKC